MSQHIVKDNGFFLTDHSLSFIIIDTSSFVKDWFLYTFDFQKFFVCDGSFMSHT
jgi:hypothetical protein